MLDKDNCEYYQSLSKREKAFVDEYYIDPNGNGTAAAIRAGYSEKTARQQASKLLTRVNIEKAIAAKRKRLEFKHEVTAEKIIAEYAKMAFANMIDYANWATGSVSFKSSQELTRDQTAAILEVYQVDSGKQVKTGLKLHDKKGSLDSLSKIFGLVIDKKQITGKDGGAVQIESVPMLTPEQLSNLSAEELMVLEKALPKLFQEQK